MLVSIVKGSAKAISRMGKSISAVITTLVCSALLLHFDTTITQPKPNDAVRSVVVDANILSQIGVVVSSLVRINPASWWSLCATQLQTPPSPWPLCLRLRPRTPQPTPPLTPAIYPPLKMLIRNKQIALKQANRRLFYSRLNIGFTAQM